MESKGLDPDIIDHPYSYMPGQPGMTTAPVKNDVFEGGLRYCMDTWQEPNDWRRKGYETAYEVPSLKMARVCMSCARRCHAKRYQRVLFVPRRSADKCSCAQTQHCKARWTQVRCEFDKIADSDESGRGQVDGCIGPQDLRTLITDLRKPIPIMEADTENAILVSSSCVFYVRERKDDRDGMAMIGCIDLHCLGWWSQRSMQCFHFR